MSHRVVLATVGIAAILVLALTGPALAGHDVLSPCVFGSTWVPADNECVLSTQVAATGVHLSDHTLRITGSGAVDAKGGGLTLTICDPVTTPGVTCDLIIQTPTVSGGGQIRANDNTGTASDSASAISIAVPQGTVEMKSGSAILAENRTGPGNGALITIAALTAVNLRGTATISSKQTTNSGGSGGGVTINVGPTDFANCTVPIGGGDLVGDLLLEDGSTITTDAQGGQAGPITIATGHNITIHGTVSAAGLGLAGRGGLVTNDACCDLTVGTTGIVRSRGGNPGADLVHLEGCCVKIRGLVESTSLANGDVSGNACSDPLNVAGRPAASGGCVEVFAGDIIVVDRTGTYKGQINVDNTATSLNANLPRRGWVDLFSQNRIIVNSATTGTFAVHANQPSVDAGEGGQIRLISSTGTISVAGRALQADATRQGGTGGDIFIEALNDVALDTASLFARGDFTSAGGFGVGGDAGTTGTPIRSYNGALTWTDGVGDVRPTGTTIAAADRGSIVLQSCTAPPDTTGTTFPANGTATTPTILADACDAGGPNFLLTTVPAVLVSDCVGPCNSPATISGVKFNDLNGDGIRDPNEPVLANWTIHIFNDDQSIHEHAVTNSLGQYTFSVPAGTYTVCERLKSGWTQRAPLVGSDLGACATHTHGGTPGPRGFRLTVVGGDLSDLNDFGNQLNAAAANPCPKPAISGFNPTATITIDPNNLSQIQDAIDALNDGESLLILPLLGTKTENVTIDKPVTVLGCSITLTAADSSAAVVTIGPGAVGGLTADIHATGSTVAGYLLQGTDHTIKNVSAFGNDIGFWITGDSNLLTGTLKTTNNTIGFLVEGSSNVLDTNNDISGNVLDGVKLTASATFNTVKKLTATDNGGSGFNVEGSSNILSENKAYLNVHGFLIVGDNNSLLKNVAGDIGKGNSLDGLRIVGDGGPLTRNKAVANGAVGINVTASATGHVLKANVSGGTGSQNNGGCEFTIAAGNTDGGSNKANGTGVSFTAAGVACLGTP